MGEKVNTFYYFL